MNKTSLIGTAAIAALSVISTSAFATATATAEITGLNISLSQIKSGGPAPTATFTVGSADAFLTYAYSYDPFTYQYVVTYGGSAVGTGGQSVGNAVANSSATLTGDAYSDDGAILSTSATASGSVVNGYESYALGEILLGSNGGYTSFTLGKNTRLDISADYMITGNLTGAVTGSNYEYAYAQVSLQLSGTNGANSQTSTAGASGYVQSYFGTLYSQPFSQSGELDVTFAGSRNSVTTGQFYGIAESYAYSNVSSVPEPTNAAFLLGGLAAIGLLARRRRAH